MRVFRHLLYQGIVNLGRNKWAQIFTMSAVTFVAFLAGLFLLLLYNFNLAVRSTQDGIQYQVYWQSGYSMDEVNSQWNDIRTWEIESIKTYTPDEALQVLVDSMSNDYDPGHLTKNNPLPPTAVIEFSLQTEQGEDFAREILSKLELLSGVERVSYNPMQMDTARTWLAVTSKVFWPLIVFMFVITGLVVANTLKLNQINRRDEVEILSLIGASSTYIKFPLLITGALQGLTGGVFSILLLKGVHFLIKDILNFPPIWVSIEFLPSLYSVFFVAALVGVGIMSSFLAGKDQVRQV